MAYDFFAAAKMGGVLVTVNTNYKVFELEYLLKQSDTKLLVMIGGTKNNDYVESVRQLCPDLANSKPGEIDSPKLPCLKTIVFAGEDCPQGMVPWKELYNIAQQVPYEQFKAVRDSLDCPRGGKYAVHLGHNRLSKRRNAYPLQYSQ